MKAFVTGINGFVGSYLAEALLNAGHSVAGTIFPGSGYENIAPIKDKLQLFILDLNDKKSFDAAISKFPPDLFFHLAGESSVKTSFQDPRRTLNTNVLGCLNVLESIKEFTPRTKILLISSGDVYGESLLSGNLTDEKVNLIPCSPYGVSKAAVDMLGRVYVKSFNMNIVIARPFSHIGPRQPDIFFIPTVARQMAEINKARTQPILKLGDLNIYRDFTDVRDVIKAYLLLMEKGRNGEAYNICSGKQYLLRDLVEMMIALSKRQITIVLDQAKIRTADIASMKPDNGKIRNEIGWEPVINMKQSLNDIYEHWLKVVN